MQFKLSTRSLTRLNGVHPKIVNMLKHAINNTDIDFTVLEGMRTLERQQHLVNTGASKTLNSRHLTGHAVDIAPYVDGQVSWHWPHYHRLADFIFWASDECDVGIEWGGNWKTFKDGPHWQLPWATYPADERFIPFQL